MGSKEPLNDDHVTHGMCPLCSEAVLRAAGQEGGAAIRPTLVEKRLADQTLHLAAETLHG
jgi:hypothetical protein